MTTRRFEMGGGLEESSRQNCPGPGTMMSKDRGFSMAELMVVAGVMLILTGIILPQIQSFVHLYALSGAAREIAGQISLTRMRAGAEITQAQFVVNPIAESYQIQTCTAKNTTTGDCSAWTSENGTQYLPPGIFFGYGSISTPADSQTTIGQTTSIIFNSRGIAITPGNNPTTNDALYLTNRWGQFCAVTVSAGGKTTVWKYTGSRWEEI